MPLPRSENLRITQDLYAQWQEIYGGRDDAEAEAANYEMLRNAYAEAENIGNTNGINESIGQPSR